MQEEVTQKTIALSMKTGKLTAQALQAALKKYLQHRAKGSNNFASNYADHMANARKYWKALNERKIFK